MSKHTENPMEIELSNSQQNRLENQLHNAFSKSEIVQIGSSRFDAKQERYNDLANEGKKADSHTLNRGIGITSYATLHKFQGNVEKFGSWCFDNGINNINQIKPEHVAGFISELCEREYAKSTVQGYCASIEKFAEVMDRVAPCMTPRSETWHEAIQSCKAEIADCPVNNEPRAYADPNAMIDALDSPQLQLVATMQLEYGLRIADATKLDAGKIEGNILTVENSKNGQDLKVELRPETIEKINELADPDGKISIKQSVYRSELKEACESTGQKWNGTHGLRHNYAQDRMDTLTNEGKSWTEALYIVSEEMGHHRVDITLTYLR
jgi:hypothetical protein